MHLLDNKFILAFRLEGKHTKGFRLEHNYSSIAFQIYDMFEKIDLGRKILKLFIVLILQRESHFK